jgi:hypothetical protein
LSHYSNKHKIEEKLFKLFICLELSITLTTKLGCDEVELSDDPNKLSCISLKAKETFIEQQKW